MVKLACLVAAMIMLVAAAASSNGWEQQALHAAAPYIDRANKEWTHAIVTGDADLMSAPYDRDGLFIGPDGAVVRGRDAVRAMYARPRSAKVLTASIKSDGRVAHDPDDVYEWGTAVTKVQHGTVVRESSGRYLTVWHREGKVWMITRNIAF